MINRKWFSVKPFRYVTIMLTLLIVSMPIACSQISLSEYQTRNRAEEEIKTVLLEYLDAKQRFDIERYLACLHDRGRFHFECGRHLSKGELGQLLPGFWDDMRSGNPAFYPINRECITGDYFDTGRYVNPRMDVGDRIARVTLRFTVGWWGLNHYVSLVREDKGWLISRLDWEMN